jgi:hypothetical protein
MSSDVVLVDSSDPHAGQNRALEAIPVSAHTEHVVIEARIEALPGRAEPYELETVADAELHEDRPDVALDSAFDRMGSALRKAPRWLIGSEVQVVVDAVLRPAPNAR